VKKRLSAGEDIWSYTALCQGRQNTPLDFHLLNYRIPMWINWGFGITGLLYWCTTNWASSLDVWTNPMPFEDQYNMEGALLDAGVRGFIASIQLRTGWARAEGAYRGRGVDYRAAHSYMGNGDAALADRDERARRCGHTAIWPLPAARSQTPRSPPCVWRCA
jgi:hypothetical protein